MRHSFGARSSLPLVRRIILLASVAIAVRVVCGVAAAAPMPTPTPAPTPVGFTARAHADISVVAPNGPLNGTIAVALAQRAGLTRIEILSVKSDTLPVPPVRFTAVIDRDARTLTLWDDATQRYYTQAFTLGAPPIGSKASPAPRPASAFVSPLAALDIFSFSMKLTGHTVTAGVPTSGLAIDVVAAKKGETATTHVTATAQIVDDFAFVPMTLDMTVEPAGMPTKVNLAFAVDDLARIVPPLSQFTVPAGYRKMGSAADVVRPARRATPPPATTTGG